LNAVGNAGGSVQLSCSSPPAGFTCNFAPNPATTAAAASNVALTVSVPAMAGLPLARFSRPRTLNGAAAQVVSAAMLTIIIFFFGLKSMHRSRVRMAFACVWVIVLLGLMAACGGSGGGGGTVPQTFEVAIQGVAGNFQHSTTVQLVID